MVLLHILTQKLAKSDHGDIPHTTHNTLATQRSRISSSTVLKKKERIQKFGTMCNTHKRKCFVESRDTCCGTHTLVHFAQKSTQPHPQVKSLQHGMHIKIHAKTNELGESMNCALTPLANFLHPQDHFGMLRRKPQIKIGLIVIWAQCDHRKGLIKPTRQFVPTFWF